MNQRILIRRNSLKHFLPAMRDLFAMAIFASCIPATAQVATNPQTNQPKETNSDHQAGRIQHLLSETAWRSIFNGENLEGWSGDVGGYRAQDGILICEKGGKNLVSEESFSDFAFRFEFKLEESGNNGIGIRVPKGGHPSQQGMEIQILDHHGSRYETEAVFADGSKRNLSWLKPWQYHGSIYGITPAKIGHLKPVGQWNEETIIAIEDHIIVILNGHVIVDTYLEQTTPVDGKAHPGMKNESGHLVFAGHSDRMEFRNLELADFSTPATTPRVSTLNQPPVGFQSLFNGQNLEGWKGLAHKNANNRRDLVGQALKDAQSAADESMHQHWSVHEGILTYDGKGQSLCTDKDYGDFDLYVEWKIPPGADSGIYLRGTPQVQIWDPWDPRIDSAGTLPDSSEAWVNAYNNGRNLGSGGLWNNKRWRNSPIVRADKKPGQWNQFLIRMVGDKVSIWLNDKRVVDRVQLENYWDKSGITPIARADQIELQHHGSELFFRNLFIRELPY